MYGSSAPDGQCRYGIPSDFKSPLPGRGGRKSEGPVRCRPAL
ncbi:hypothetical protein [Azospirillum palustre]